MAITKIYGPYFQNLQKGLIPDLSSAGTPIKVALMASPFAFNQDHATMDQVRANECADADYPGAVEITNKTVTYSGLKTVFDTTLDPKKTLFTSSGTITATHAVIFYDSGVDATSPLICCVDFEGEQASVDGEFSITWDLTGIFEVTVA